MNRESIKIEEIEQLVGFWQCANTGFEKNAIFAFPRGSAETQVIWCGIVKCLLIAYFISNISAKTYQNPFTCVKVIASQMWDVFLRHGVKCPPLQVNHRNVEPLARARSTCYYVNPALGVICKQHDININIMANILNITDICQEHQWVQKCALWHAAFYSTHLILLDTDANCSRCLIYNMVCKNHEYFHERRNCIICTIRFHNSVECFFYRATLC